jgi:signal transduction histidine kinase
MSFVRNVSVQRRLSALVVIQALSAFVFLLLAFSTMGRLVSHTRYTDRFILEPMAAIGTILEDNATLHESASAEEIRAFVERTERFATRYRGHWQLSGSTNPDALRQLGAVRGAHDAKLVDEERLAVDDLVAAVRGLDASARTGAPPATISGFISAQRAALYRLMDANLQLGAMARDKSEAITRQTAWTMAVVGLAAITASTLFGFGVRNTIVPRIRQLVHKVRRFQEFGVNEPIAEPGKDELAILSHALDAGFAAIAARERERDHFLAVMAHELKTPLSNIKGFAQAALDFPERAEVRTRAIVIISRQANRLVRLVEDLFLVSRAHAHQLPFVPSPMMLSPLVERIAAEVSSHERNADVRVEVDGAAPMLADESLLAQALWTMFAYAVGRAGSSAVTVKVSVTAFEAVTSIHGFGPRFSAEELTRVFEPFSSIGYEGPSSGERRNILGLYLCGEIAKAHGGLLRAFNEPDGSPALTLTLPV